jgi:4-nitrophenyl phosphatase
MAVPAVVLDLDGVVWLADEPLPGAADAVARLRTAGVEVVFVTNNAGPTVGEQEAKLASHGIDASGAVVTSPMAAATLVEPGWRVLAAGGPGVVEAIADRGATPVDYAAADAPGAEPVDAVVVGLHRDFDWERMRIAADSVRAGARFIATNDDATFPTPSGPVPGAGAIVAGIAAASGTQPVVAGKPYGPLADLLRQRLGPDGMVIGDRADTDGRLAGALGWRFGLVLSGVTGRDDLPVDPEPDVVADDLAGLADALLRS